MEGPDGERSVDKALCEAAAAARFPRLRVLCATTPSLAYYPKDWAAAFPALEAALLGAPTEAAHWSRRNCPTWGSSPCCRGSSDSSSAVCTAARSCLARWPTWRPASS